jgi:uncharacterized protein (DUF302 family)
MKKLFLAVILLSMTLPSWASSPAIYEKQIKGELASNYDKINAALEANGFYVIFEPNVGKNLEGMASDLGKDYNRNQLEGIRSMVFCNARYANRLSNVDPASLALCPLHLTLIQKNGVTTVLFVKPSVVTQGSPAQSVAKEIEITVIKLITETAK